MNWIMQNWQPLLAFAAAVILFVRTAWVLSSTADRVLGQVLGVIEVLRKSNDPAKRKAAEQLVQQLKAQTIGADVLQRAQLGAGVSLAEKAALGAPKRKRPLASKIARAALALLHALLRR